MNSEDGGVETFSLAHCLYRLLYSLEMLAGWLVVLPASWWHVLCSGWWWCRWIRRWAFSSPPTIRRRTSDGVVAENSLLLILCLLLLRLLMLLLLSTPSHHHHYYYPNNSIYAKSLWARKYENTTIMKSLWPTTTNFLLSSSFWLLLLRTSKRTNEWILGGWWRVSGLFFNSTLSTLPPFLSLSPPSAITFACRWFVFLLMTCIFHCRCFTYSPSTRQPAPFHYSIFVILHNLLASWLAGQLNSHPPRVCTCVNTAKGRLLFYVKTRRFASRVDHECRPIEKNDSKKKQFHPLLHGMHSCILLHNATVDLSSITETTN